MVFDRVLPTAPRLGCDEDMLVMNNYKSSESDSNGLSRYAEILLFNGCSKYLNCLLSIFKFMNKVNSQSSVGESSVLWFIRGGQICPN